MKKNLFSVFLLILMIASLMLLSTGCGANQDAADDAAARIAELEQENARLQAQLDALTSQASQSPQKAALQDWSLEAKAWNDGNGATVTFTASPISYADGMRAALSVRMGDLEAESTNCVWDGTAFVGSVELSAADGYSYYCILTNPDDSREEVELNAPDNVTNETLVYLGSSLSAYANLVVEDWDATGTALTLKSGYIQVQMPQLNFNGQAPSVNTAALVLKLNDEEVGRQEIALSASEGEGSFEAVLNGQSFTMPAMEEDHQLDLWLEVALNSGSTISAAGGSWYGSNGQLQLVVG